MTFCTDDRKSTRILHFLRKLDVGTTTCHICSDGNCACLTCVCDNLCLTSVLLRVEHLVLDAAKAEHTAQELRSLDVCCTDEHRTAFLGKFHNLIDHGVELSLLCLVDDVILVLTRDRSVCRDHNDIEFVDRPELACLSLCGTCHTGKFVVHTEVVLESDGCKSLGCSLHLDVLLGLDSLVESVAPTASFHNTAGLLIHDLDFAVLDNVVDLLVEHCVSLKELSHSVHTLRLKCEVRKDLILLHLLLSCCERRLLNLCNRSSHVRKHKEVRIRQVTCDQVAALVGHIHRVLLLVDDEVELVSDDVHLALVVLDVVVLNLLEELLHTRLTEELDEWLIFRITLICSEEEKTTVLLISVRDEFLCLIEELVHEGLLGIVKALHEWLVLHKLLVLTLRHRT